MIRIVLALLAVVFVSACKETDDGLSFSEEVSPGGLPFTMIRIPESEDIAIEIAWTTDWAYRDGENQAVPTIAVETILTGGAEGHPPDEVAERFADMETEAYLTNSVDHVYGELLIMNEHIDESIEIANAHLRAPLLDEVWLDRAREALVQKTEEFRANPTLQGFDAVRVAVFGDGALRRAMGAETLQRIQAVTDADVRDWMAATLTSAPAVITVTGDIPAAQAAAALDQLFEGLPAATGAAPGTVEADFSPRRILLHEPEAETTQLSFIGQLPPTRLGGEFEDLILALALGSGDQSVLFHAVRTELRASYAFGAGLANYTRENRVLFMTGAVDPEKLAEAETVVRTAYAGFRQTGADGALKDRVTPIRNEVEENREYVDTMGFADLESQLDGLPAGRSLGLLAELDAITAEGLQARLKAAFPAPEDFILIAVSPDADALPGACVITDPSQAADCP